MNFSCDCIGNHSFSHLVNYSDARCALRRHWEPLIFPSGKLRSGRPCRSIILGTTHFPIWQTTGGRCQPESMIGNHSFSHLVNYAWATERAATDWEPLISPSNKPPHNNMPAYQELGTTHFPTSYTTPEGGHAGINQELLYQLLGAMSRSSYRAQLSTRTPPG